MAALRAAMLAAATTEDILALVRMLVKQAKEGNIAAAREVLDRCVGRPLEADLLERLDALEARAKQKREAYPWARSGVG